MTPINGIQGFGQLGARDCFGEWLSEKDSALAESHNAPSGRQKLTRQERT
jgi:hypothetical protein